MSLSTETHDEKLGHHDIEGKTESLTESNEAPMSMAEDKSILWKIDMNLLPFLFMTYMLQFLDKGTLGYASILGIRRDTNLVGQRYSLVSSSFYFGYLVASPIVSVLLVKLPLGKVVAGAIILWAFILGSHGATNSFAGLMVARILLGAFEAVISPGFSLITSVWYKPSEHALRHGLWFAGNGIAGICGSILAYAIGHIDTPIAAWRWLFIIFGLITLAWGLVLAYFLPDNALKARWLTPRQQHLAYVRPQKMHHSFQTREYKLSQVIEAFKDPKSWMLFAYTIVTQVANGGVTNFTSLIINGIVKDPFHAILYGMPQGAFQFGMTLVSAFLAHKIRKSRCIIITILQIISVMAFCLFGFLPESNTQGRLGGVSMSAAFACGFPLSLSLIATDVAGFTKKTVVSAMLLLGYCVGNIIGPNLFYAKEAPKYKTGINSCIGCLCAGSVIMMCLRQYMNWENKKRDREQGVVIDPESRAVKEGLVEGEGPQPSVDVDVDETDFENRSFRYYL